MCSYPYTNLVGWSPNYIPDVSINNLHTVSLQLWDSSTGMVLADFKGHKDSVTCCALSASGKLVASSSEDNTVKVIKIVMCCNCCLMGLPDID